MKKGDIAIIAVLLCCAAMLFVLSLATGGAEGATAVISVNGRIEARLPLDRDTEYTLSANGHTNVICIADGQVFMRSASCPDGHCMAQGAVSRTGELIVCLPNRVTVTVEGSDDALDSVAY